MEIMTTNTQPQTQQSGGDELRKHNELDSMFTAALMKEHADDWSMEVVREAALICSNTLLLGQPNTAFMQDHDIEVLIDKHDRDVAVLGLKYHGYSTSAAELTRKLSKQLAAIVQDREWEAEQRGRIDELENFQWNDPHMHVHLRLQQLTEPKPQAGEGGEG
jgi:hypothetical protein